MDPVLASVLRLSLALLLGGAALHKLRHPAAFRLALASYALIPAALLGVAPWFFVAAELGLAVSMVAPASGAAPALGTALLLALYSGAIAINLLRGRRDIACGCGGPASRGTLGWGLLLRNGVLVAVAMLAALPEQLRPLVWLDLVTVALGVATLALLWNASGLLASHAPALVQRRISG